MSDDRKEEGVSFLRANRNESGDGEPGSTVPFGAERYGTANMLLSHKQGRRAHAAAIDAIHLQRRRAYAAMLASSVGGSSTPIVLEDGSTPIVREEPPGLQGEVALQGEGRLTVSETVLSPWAAVRVEMVAKLDAIEAGLQRIAPVIETFATAYREHARIGHNNPP